MKRRFSRSEALLRVRNRDFRSLNACVLRVSVSIQIKPCFVCKESLTQNGQIVANEIKKPQTILMASLRLATLAPAPHLLGKHETLNFSEP